MRSILTWICFALVSLALEGCTTFQSSEASCLKTILVNELSRAPLYPVHEHDSRVAILSLEKVTCNQPTQDTVDATPSTLINLKLSLPEARKRTGRTTKVIFPIFVALLDSEENVIDRHDEHVQVTINDKPLAHNHTITYRLPDNLDMSGKEYQLLVGFNGNVMSATSSQISHPVKKAFQNKDKKKRAKKKSVAQR